jgi:hypothetical protein
MANVKLGIQVENGDTGEQDSMSIALSVTEETAIAALDNVSREPNQETLTVFFQILYGNPDFDDSSSKGVAYDEIWKHLTEYGWNNLGWEDVMATVDSINVDGKAVEISDDDLEYTLGQELKLQLSREESVMYICG